MKIALLTYVTGKVRKLDGLLKATDGGTKNLCIYAFIEAEAFML